MMRRKSNRNQRDDEANTLERVLSKYRALKRAFRKLSEDYDYNFALFKERDEELDLLEEQLKIENEDHAVSRTRARVGARTRFERDDGFVTDALRSQSQIFLL